MIGLVDFVSQFDVWMRMTFETFRSDHDYHEQSFNVIQTFTIKSDIYSLYIE